jgi:hypothetical protein
MSSTIFTEFLRVVDISICAQGRHICCWHTLCCFTARYVISTEHKIGVLSTKLPTRDTFPNKWIWLDAAMNVISPSHVSVDNGFDTRGVSSKDELCDGCECGGCGRNEEEKDKI